MIPASGRGYFFGLVKDPFVRAEQPKDAVPLELTPERRFLTHTGGAQTISPKFSLGAGYVAYIHWGDGNTSTITGPVTEAIFSHAYAIAVDHEITLSGDYWHITYINFYSMAVTGDIADLPSGLDYANFSSTNVTCTSIAAHGIGYLNLKDNAYAQAQVDAIVENIYTNWASFTDATPELIIDGTDAAPSGTYQDGDPPTTGKEYIYEIVNDPETTGNHKWTVTYNS